MPDYRDDDDDDESGVDDAEFPDEADRDHDEGDETAETMACTSCGRSIYEQAEVCPHCGKYVSAEDAPSRKPRWIILGVIVCLIIILLAWIV